MEVAKNHYEAQSRSWQGDGVKRAPWHADSINTSSDFIPADDDSSPMEAEWNANMSESLQCSVSDLQLCLGLGLGGAPVPLPNQPSSTAAAAPGSFRSPLHFNTAYNQESFLSDYGPKGEDFLMPTGLGGVEDSLYNRTGTSYLGGESSLTGLAGHSTREDFAALDDPRRLAVSEQSPHCNPDSHWHNSNSYPVYDSNQNRETQTCFISSTSTDLNLSTQLDGSMRFSPLTSTSHILQPTTNATSSASSAATSLDEITGLTHNALTKHNYFLTFHDAQQSSVNSVSGNGLGKVVPYENLSPEMNSSRTGTGARLEDSGTVCSSSSSSSNGSDQEQNKPPRLDSRQSSVSSGKLRCWTDVQESYDGDAGDKLDKEVSFIASLNEKDRNRRASSTPKTTGPVSPGYGEGRPSVSLGNLAAYSRSDDTSGYSSSPSATTSGSLNTKRSLLVPSAAGMRQSPSLPLHVERQVNKTSPATEARHQPTGDTAFRPSNAMTRAKVSAPDLSFLSTHTQMSSQPPSAKAAVPGGDAGKMPRPFSCPDRFVSPSETPLRVNVVDDWESLRVLLPPHLQRHFLQQHNAADFQKNEVKPSAARAPSVPWGIHPEEHASNRQETLSRRSSQDSQDVCPTCFKMQQDLNGEPGQMARSVCDCSPSTSSSSAPHHSLSSGQANTTSSLFDSFYAGLPMYQSTNGDNVFDDLMEFSRNNRTDGGDHFKVVIDLKHKQELVTAVKAAAIGWLGLASFRGVRKVSSEGLMRLISRQFSSALWRLLEDGLHAGHTVWSALVCSCSSPAYIRLLVRLLQNNSKTASDEEHFLAFVNELLRVGQLSDWLIQTVGQEPSRLRPFYSMDGFAFLTSSITRELWDDLLDTLACLTQVSHTEPATPSAPSPKYHPTLVQPQLVSPRSASRTLKTEALAQSQASATSSVKRLASKLKQASGRQISVLPIYPNLQQPKRNDLKVSPAKVDPLDVLNVQQPHLQMKSRWSEWQLSKLAADEPGSKNTLPENAAGFASCDLFVSVVVLAFSVWSFLIFLILGGVANVPVSNDGTKTI